MPPSDGYEFDQKKDRIHNPGHMSMFSLHIFFKVKFDAVAQPISTHFLFPFFRYFIHNPLLFDISFFLLFYYLLHLLFISLCIPLKCFPSFQSNNLNSPCWLECNSPPPTPTHNPLPPTRVEILGDSKKVYAF